MSSCTNTFRNLFPLCTSNVCPTNSGMIVHARAHVLIGCFARRSFSIETFRNSFSATNGPFLALLLILNKSAVGSWQWAVNRITHPAIELSDADFLSFTFLLLPTAHC